MRSEPHITGAELARRLNLQPRSGQRILHRVKGASESISPSSGEEVDTEPDAS